MAKRPVVSDTPKRKPAPKFDTESYAYNHRSRNNLKRGNPKPKPAKDC